MPSFTSTSRQRRTAWPARARGTPATALRAWVTVLLIIGMLVGGLLPQPVRGDEEQPRVLPQLAREATAAPEQTFRVIVQRRNKDTRADGAVAAKGHQKLAEVASDSFVAAVAGKDIADLGRHPAVKHVSIDAPMLVASSPDDGRVEVAKLGTLYPRAVAAPSGWAAGVTGRGVGVAVVDTGIAKKADFAEADADDGADESRVIAQAKFNSTTRSMADRYGHGTHVAGIIAGNSWTSSEQVRGKYIGIAPQANLINVKISDDQGRAYLSDMVNAIEWVIQNRERYNIRVMNLALVSSVGESYKTSILCAAVERAWFSGILVVVSAGNAGPNMMYYPPANDPFVITVGATDTNGTGAPSDDTLAPWSSYGVSQDGVSKPDVVAPGRYITAPLAATGAILAKRFPDRLVDQHYLWLSGTSMSAAVVSGVAAQVFEKHPRWTNDQVKWLLMNQATTLAGAPPLGQGAGQVQAERAWRYSDTPRYANQGLTISAQLVGPNGATTYANRTASGASSSWSSSSWSSSSWSSSSWSSSSWSSSSWSTASWSSSLR